MRSPYSQITTPSPLKILDYKSLLGFAAIDWISGVVVSISRFHYGYGNIKVFCRTRPLFEDEGPSVVEFPDDFTIRVNTGDDTVSNPKKDYEFDRVYGSHIGQSISSIKHFDTILEKLKT
ncbi:kinesin-like protein KIN-14B [Tanacetum coccineum]